MSFYAFEHCITYREIGGQIPLGIKLWIPYLALLVSYSLQLVADFQLVLLVKDTPFGSGGQIMDPLVRRNKSP